MLTINFTNKANTVYILFNFYYLFIYSLQYITQRLSNEVKFCDVAKRILEFYRSVPIQAVLPVVVETIPRLMFHVQSCCSYLV